MLHSAILFFRKVAHSRLFYMHTLSCIRKQIEEKPVNNSSLIKDKINKQTKTKQQQQQQQQQIKIYNFFLFLFFRKKPDFCDFTLRLVRYRNLRLDSMARATACDV